MTAPVSLMRPGVAACSPSLPISELIEFAVVLTVAGERMRWRRRQAGSLAGMAPQRFGRSSVHLWWMVIMPSLLRRAPGPELKLPSLLLFHSPSHPVHTLRASSDAVQWTSLSPACAQPGDAASHFPSLSLSCLLDRCALLSGHVVNIRIHTASSWPGGEALFHLSRPASSPPSLPEPCALLFRPRREHRSP